MTTSNYQNAKIAYTYIEDELKYAKEVAMLGKGFVDKYGKFLVTPKKQDPKLTTFAGMYVSAGTYDQTHQEDAGDETQFLDQPYYVNKEKQKLIIFNQETYKWLMIDLSFLPGIIDKKKTNFRFIDSINGLKSNVTHNQALDDVVFENFDIKRTDGFPAPKFNGDSTIEVILKEGQVDTNKCVGVYEKKKGLLHKFFTYVNVAQDRYLAWNTVQWVFTDIKDRADIEQNNTHFFGGLEKNYTADWPWFNKCPINSTWDKYRIKYGLNLN